MRITKLKFCVKSEDSSADIIRKIKKTFREDSVSDIRIKLWNKWFKDGWESVESDPHLMSRTPENIESV